MHSIGKKLLAALILLVCIALLTAFVRAEESFAVPEEADLTEQTEKADEDKETEEAQPAAETEAREDADPAPEQEQSAKTAAEETEAETTVPEGREAVPEEPVEEQEEETPEIPEETVIPADAPSGPEGSDTPGEQEETAEQTEPAETAEPTEQNEPAEETEPEETAGTEPAPETEPFPCGEALFWQIGENGTKLTFLGSGAMTAFGSPEEVPWNEYRETVTDIVFPDGITAIGAYAFSGFSALEKAVIPGSTESVGAHAFENCEKLTEIVFTGECPVFGSAIFSGSLLTVFYPAECLSWQGILSAELGEEITLIPYEPEMAEGTEQIEERPEEQTEPEPDGEGPVFLPEIVLEKEYLRLEPGEQYRLVAGPNFETDEILWSVTGEAVTLEDGLVTAVDHGISYITASAVYEDNVYSAVCCVEVAYVKPVQAEITDIRLITAAATVEVFKTEYARIRLLPVMSVSLSTHSDTHTTDTSGAAVEKAAFTNSAADEYFALRVINNETLEIVPRFAALEAAKQGSKSMKNLYVTGITVSAGGKEYTPYETVRLKIRRSRPYIEAEPVIFNSYPPMLGEKTPFTFRGGKVTSVTLLNEAPSWLEFDPYKMEAGLSPTYVPDKYEKGKLVLSCEVEGWAVPARATVKYSGKNYQPKLSFSEKNITLFADTGDTAEISVKLSPGVYADTQRFPITLKSIEEKKEKGYVAIENGSLLKATYRNGLLTVNAPEPAEDGEEHIYRVNLTAVGKDFSLAVRVPAAGAAPKPSLRTSGAIDPSLPGSAFVITAAKKNYHKDALESYSLTAVEQYKGKTPVNSDVRDFFTVTEDGNSFLLREKTPGTLPTGYTYRAVITLRTAAGEGTAACTVKINAAGNPAALKVSVQTDGILQISEPGSAIVLTPSVRPRRKEEQLSLVFFKKKGGKSERIDPEECPFEVKMNEDGTFSLYANELTEPGALYYVQLLVTYNGKTYASKATKLSVKR